MLSLTLTGVSPLSGPSCLHCQLRDPVICVLSLIHCVILTRSCFFLSNTLGGLRNALASLAPSQIISGFAGDGKAFKLFHFQSVFPSSTTEVGLCYPSPLVSSWKPRAPLCRKSTCSLASTESHPGKSNQWGGGRRGNQSANWEGKLGWGISPVGERQGHPIVFCVGGDVVATPVTPWLSGKIYE